VGNDVGRNPGIYKIHGSRRTCPVLSPHTRRTAQRPGVRALRAAFPARSPLLPARMRSLRAASMFLTSPPQQDKWARSGTLRLCSASEQVTGRTNPETHWGTRNRPRPQEKHGPGSMFPRPLLPPPETTTVPAAQMTGESASTTVRAAPRPWNSAPPPIPRCPGTSGNCKDRGGHRETPQSRGFPVSPAPPSALPPPEGAPRAPHATPMPARSR